MRFKVLREVKTSIMPCGFVVGYQRYRGTYRLHVQGLHGVTTQKTMIDKHVHK
jgi:hypothetical protein